VENDRLPSFQGAPDGWQRFNRLGYLITEKRAKTGVEYEVLVDTLDLPYM